MVFLERSHGLIPRLRSWMRRFHCWGNRWPVEPVPTSRKRLVGCRVRSTGSRAKLNHTQTETPVSNGIPPVPDPAVPQTWPALIHGWTTSPLAQQVTKLIIMALLTWVLAKLGISGVTNGIQQQ